VNRVQTGSRRLRWHNFGRQFGGSEVALCGFAKQFRETRVGTAATGLGIRPILIVPAGNLTLDGVLNITPLSGFGEGQYALFLYRGDLTTNGTANLLTLGSVPDTEQYAYGFELGDKYVLLNIAAIPEPSSLLLVGAGLGLLLLVRRRS